MIRKNIPKRMIPTKKVNLSKNAVLLNLTKGIYLYIYSLHRVGYEKGSDMWDQE